MKRIGLLMMMLLTAFVFAACSSDDDDNAAGLTDQMMYAGDSVRISSNATVANRFVAYVSKNGYLHGFHVGQTTVSLNGESANVTVRGRYNAFDVQTDWGLTPEQVKANQKGGTLRSDDTINGTRMLIYENVGTANVLTYGFKNNRLYIAMALSNPKDEEEILNYLTERYIFLPEEVESYTWAGVDALDEEYAKTIAYLKLDTDLKYDYMLQSTFMSIDAISSTKNAKVFTRSINKIMKAD